MNNRLEKIVLNYLLGGAMLRHRVGSKIKNYPKEMRVNAINNLLENSYIKMLYGENKGKARIPVFIEITSKGRDFLSQLSEEPTENTV